MMAKVTGFGGIFFKTADRAATAKWFSEKLDLGVKEWGAMLPSDPKGFIVLGLHKAESDYFGPSKQPFMLNLRVDDLEGVLAKARDRGVEVIKVFDPDDNGQFAHIVGPNDITIELWQPKADDA